MGELLWMLSESGMPVNKALMGSCWILGTWVVNYPEIMFYLYVPLLRNQGPQGLSAATGPGPC